MRKFRIASATAVVIADAAKKLRRALKEQGVRKDTDAVTDELNKLVTELGQGKTSEKPAYNQAGDTLALAYQAFQGGDIETALHMVALGFVAEDCRPLMDAIVKCNDEAKPEDDDDGEAEAFNSADDNNDNDDNDDKLAENHTTSDQPLTARDQKYLKKLNKSIRKVTASIVANADDDDNNDNDNNNNNNDAASVSDADDDDNNDNNNDDNNDDDDAEKTGKIVGDNMPAMASDKILHRLRNQPDVIAAANKISLGGSKKSRQKAGKFVRSVANLSSTSG